MIRCNRCSERLTVEEFKRHDCRSDDDDDDVDRGERIIADGDGNQTFSGPGQYHDQPSWVPDDDHRRDLDVVTDPNADFAMLAVFDPDNDERWFRCEQALAINLEGVR